MSPWRKSIGAITVFVEDMARSKSFYQEVFGLPVVYEDEDSAVFRFENTIVNLLKSSAAQGLVEPAVVGTREAGPRFQLTVWVDNTDSVCDELKTLGVTLLNGPMNREWGQRTASFTDPDGNIWEVAQAIPRAEPS